MLNASKAKEISELAKDVQFNNILTKIKERAETGFTDSCQHINLHDKERLERLGYIVFDHQDLLEGSFYNRLCTISWK